MIAIVTLTTWQVAGDSSKFNSYTVPGNSEQSLGENKSWEKLLRMLDHSERSAFDCNRRFF
jgi:hypothetical protein